MARARRGARTAQYRRLEVSEHSGRDQSSADMSRVRGSTPGSGGSAEEPKQVAMMAIKSRKRSLSGRARSTAAKSERTNASLTLKAYEELKERIIVGYFLAGQYLK